MNYLKYLKLISFCVIFIAASASDKRINTKEASEIIKKVTDYFKDTEKFTVNLEFKSFNGHDSNAPYEVKSGVLKKQGHNFNSFVMGIRTIQNDKYQLLVDTTRRFISIRDAEMNMWETINSIPIGKSLEATQEIYLGRAELFNCLKLIPVKSSSLNYYEVQYDESYRIRNVIMKLTKQVAAEDGKTQKYIYPKVNIKFYGYTNGTGISNDDFNLNKYVTFNGNDVSLNERYKNFKFYDLRVNDKLKN
jgi:hypothetical protein